MRCEACGAESRAATSSRSRARAAGASTSSVVGRRGAARGVARAGGDGGGGGMSTGPATRPQRYPTSAPVEEVHILWISEGMSCDGDTVSITAATQPGARGRRARPDPRPAEGAPAQQGARPSLGGEEFLEPFRAAAARRARRAVRARDRGLDPEREDQRRGLLDVVRQRRGHRRADHAQLVDRRARARRVGRRRVRHVRDLRRHPRDGRQPDRLHGPRRLPRLGLPLRRRAADRERPGLPGAAGQLHGDAHLAAVPGGRASRR